MVIYFVPAHRIVQIDEQEEYSMRRGPRSALITAILIMALWTVVQLFGTLRQDETSKDARILLYEASLFQAELLSGFASEGRKLTTTEQLNGLKQAAYSVEYTHGKLVEAWGKAIPELASVSRLMEWIVRMQIGGDRALKPDERELLNAVAPHFQQLYDAYALLLTEDGNVVGTHVDEMKNADGEIARLLLEHVK